MKKVLVLCTGNSCRSIIAEGIINHLGKGRFLAESAGSLPAGYIHPESLATLQRHGIDVPAARSKSWDEFGNQEFDLVITVCDQAASETCPAFLGSFEKRHWSTPDPAKVSGTAHETTAPCETTYQLLKSRVEKELL